MKGSRICLWEKVQTIRIQWQLRYHRHFEYYINSQEKLRILKKEEKKKSWLSKVDLIENENHIKLEKHICEYILVKQLKSSENINVKRYQLFK